MKETVKGALPLNHLEVTSARERGAYKNRGKVQQLRLPMVPGMSGRWVAGTMLRAEIDQNLNTIYHPSLPLKVEAFDRL